MRLNRILAVVVPMLVAGSAAAFPDKPVRIVNGFAAGGGSDILLRAIVPAFSARLGQQILIDYKVGAGGILAMETVARATADGYTLLMGAPGLATSPSLNANLTFDPLKDFAPISLVGIVQNVLVVHPSIPANSAAELAAYIKSRPGKINFTSPGGGTTQHLAGELYKLSAGLDMVHIPYKGGAQAQADVVGGQAELTFNVVPSALPLIRAGKLRALAVTGRQRAAALPDVPTMVESGYANFTAFTWNGILAPAGTPRSVIMALHEALVGALKTTEMQEQLAKLGQESAWSTPEEFGAFLREETEKWRKVIPAAGLKPQ